MNLISPYLSVLYIIKSVRTINFIPLPISKDAEDLFNVHAFKLVIITPTRHIVLITPGKSGLPIRILFSFQSAIFVINPQQLSPS